MHRFLVAPVVLALLALAPSAHAQQTDVAALEAELQRAVALTGGACVVACPALGSMARAADRICALSPGPRCDAARAKVKDARRKVQQACPECALGGDDEPPAPVQVKEKEAPRDPRGSVSPLEPPAQSPAATVNQPPPAPPRGGCAGCATTDAADTRPLLLAGLVLLAALRRRR